MPPYCAMERAAFASGNGESCPELSTLPVLSEWDKKAPPMDPTQDYFASPFSSSSEETMDEDDDQDSMKSESSKEQHHEIDESQPCEYDVVCGRDKFSHSHIGNKRFRVLIEMHRERYQTAPSRDDKTRITCKIVGMIRSWTPGGRFLKLDPQTKEWYDVGDEYAREKVSHALRSAKDPALRKPRRKRKPSVAPRKKPVHSELANRVFNQLLADQKRIFENLIREDTNSRRREDAAKGKR